MSVKALFEALARALGLYFAVVGLIGLAALLVAPGDLIAESLLVPVLSLLTGAGLLFKADVIAERVFGSRGDADG